MKKIYVAIILLVIALPVVSQTTYTWAGPSGITASWAVATNWIPNRVSLAPDDILVFDGSVCANPIVDGMPSSQSIGKLRVCNNANTFFVNTITSFITIGNATVAAPHFAVESGSRLRVTASAVTSFAIPSPFTALIQDTLLFSGNDHRIVSTTPGSVIFSNGGVFRTAAGFTGSPFGTTNSRAVIFQSGSVYISGAGSNPFGAAAPSTACIFEKGSLFSYRQPLSPSLSGRTYANFEIDFPTFNQSPTGNLPFRCDTFRLKNATALIMNMLGGTVISGDLDVQVGNLMFAPTAPNTGTLLFDGNVPQHIRGITQLNGATTFKVTVAKGAEVSLDDWPIGTSDTLSVYGKLYTNNHFVAGTTFYLPDENYSTTFTGSITINSNQVTSAVLSNTLHSGMLVTGTGIPVNTYVMKIVGNVIHLSRFATASSTTTFTATTSRGTLGIGSADGIADAPVLLGNVQTTNRHYNKQANYEYTGTTAQVTGSGLPSSVKNLILNTSGYQTVTLNDSVNVDDTLNLQNGFLLSDALVMPNLRDTTAILSPSNNYGINNIGWEKSFVRGPMRREVNSSTKHWYPVGKINGTDTLFAPAAIQTTYTTPVADTVEYFAASYIDTAANHGQLDHVSAIEHWYMSTDVLTTAANGKITLSWRPTSAVGDGNPVNDAAALDDLVVSHYIDDDGGGANPFLWHIEGGDAAIMPKSGGATVNYGTLTTNLDNSVNDPATPSISPYFTLGTRSPFNILPLKLLDLRAIAQKNAIEVNWKVSEEQQLSHYEVEKSTDGLHFTKIGSVASVNSTTAYSYNSLDNNPQSGWNYYRLKIITSAGKHSFSPICKVWYGKTSDFLVYPNPAQNELKINLPPTSSINQIVIVNTNGRVVKQLTTTEQSLTINIESLSTGMYFVRILNSRQAIAQKFTKQ